MKRLHWTQERAVARRFMAGWSIQTLADLWRVERHDVEAAIRRWTVRR